MEIVFWGVVTLCFMFWIEGLFKKNRCWEIKDDRSNLAKDFYHYKFLDESDSEFDDRIIRCIKINLRNTK